MKIRVEKIGSIWHGTIEGRTDIDERGLTEEIARRKVEEIVAQLRTTGSPHAAVATTAPRKVRRRW
jgi:hypothetical protein